MACYTTRILSTERDIASIADAWLRLRQGRVRPHIAHHPDWLAIERPAVPDAAMVVALYDGAELAGVAPFLLHRRRWECRVGYTTRVVDATMSYVELLDGHARRHPEQWRSWSEPPAPRRVLG